VVLGGKSRPVGARRVGALVVAMWRALNSNYFSDPVFTRSFLSSQIEGFLLHGTHVVAYSILSPPKQYLPQQLKLAPQPDFPRLFGRHDCLHDSGLRLGAFPYARPRVVDMKNRPAMNGAARGWEPGDYDRALRRRFSASSFSTAATAQGPDLGNSLSVGGGVGSFQKGNLRTQSQGLHYPHKVADRRTPCGHGLTCAKDKSC
jgi:hypothetical protein